MYELETTLPGPSFLKIEVWDHDDFFSDELIGRTKIDLEDRFFSSQWNKLKEKPIEARSLTHKSTKVNQGTIYVWVDILPKKQK
jgi:Ca2+-dependent lipid-binding protein